MQNNTMNYNVKQESYHFDKKNITMGTTLKHGVIEPSVTSWSSSTTVLLCHFSTWLITMDLIVYTVVLYIFKTYGI